MHQHRKLAGVIVCTALFTIGPQLCPAIAGERPIQPANGSGKPQPTRKAKAAKRGPAADSGADAEPKAENAQNQEIEMLKQLIAAQQQQIEQLRVAMEEQKQMIQQALNEKKDHEPLSPNLGEVASAMPGVPPSREELIAGAGALSARANPVRQDQVRAPEVELMKGELKAVAEGASQTNQRLAKLETTVSDAEKKNAARVKGLGNFNFSGDLRFRYEPFFQEGNPTRQRERMRARLNITGKITDEVSGGLSVASGTLDDVNSTNQSLTGFFTRKTIGFDKYYLTYKPKWAKPLTLQAGKATYPWFRTPLTFDNDVNPEGLSQTLSFDLKSPGLKNITVVGFQLPFNEVGSGYDSFIFGGQIQARFKATDRTSFAIYASGVNFNRADPIAAAIGAGTLRPSLANSNTFITNSSGTVTGYASKFAYLDLISVVDYKLSARWPMTLTFNFVNNTRAATQERSAYMADITFGQLKEAKDIQFGYSYWWVEKDAVIGAFNESDLRSSTNVKNHRLLLGYQGFNNVTFQWTTWLGKLDDPFQNTSLVPSGIRSNCTTVPFTNCHDSLLTRMQFDFIYKF